MKLYEIPFLFTMSPVQGGSLQLLLVMMQVFGCDHTVEKYSYKTMIWLCRKQNIFSERVNFVSRVEYLKSGKVVNCSYHLVFGQLMCYGTHEAEVWLTC
jgi:hypothetical protein